MRYLRRKGYLQKDFIFILIKNKKLIFEVSLHHSEYSNHKHDVQSWASSLAGVYIWSSNASSFAFTKIHKKIHLMAINCAFLWPSATIRWWIVTPVRIACSKILEEKSLHIVYFVKY